MTVTSAHGPAAWAQSWRQGVAGFLGIPPERVSRVATGVYLLALRDPELARAVRALRDCGPLLADVAEDVGACLGAARRLRDTLEQL